MRPDAQAKRADADESKECTHAADRARKTHASAGVAALAIGVRVHHEIDDAPCATPQHARGKQKDKTLEQAVAQRRNGGRQACGWGKCFRAVAAGSACTPTTA